MQERESKDESHFECTCIQTPTCRVHGRTSMIQDMVHPERAFHFCPAMCNSFMEFSCYVCNCFPHPICEDHGPIPCKEVEAKPSHSKHDTTSSAKTRFVHCCVRKCQVHSKPIPCLGLVPKKRSFSRIEQYLKPNPVPRAESRKESSLSIAKHNKRKYAQATLSFSSKRTLALASVIKDSWFESFTINHPAYWRVFFAFIHCKDLFLRLRIILN